MTKAAILLAHKLHSDEARASVRALADHLAARYPDCAVTAAFLDADGDDAPAAAAQRLSQGGAEGIFIIPHFLHRAGHVERDLPALLADLHQALPGVRFSQLKGLWEEPLVEDALAMRLAEALFDPEGLPVLGAEIEQRSHQIIDRRLADSPLAVNERIVARRIIHATADFSFAETLRFHPEAVARGVAALRAGKPVICDVQMLRSGVTRTAAETVCLIDDPAVKTLAQEKGMTRAAAAMLTLGERLNGAVIAIGNAPTAIWQLLKMPHVDPAVVIGLPVGMVGAWESKTALAQSSLPYIANLSQRGGSPAAAAAVNALALLARDGAS